MASRVAEDKWVDVSLVHSVSLELHDEERGPKCCDDEHPPRAKERRRATAHHRDDPGDELRLATPRSPGQRADADEETGEHDEQEARRVWGPVSGQDYSRASC